MHEADTTVAAAARPAAPSRAGIASFPAPLKRNPYQRLLYDQLIAQGFALAPGSRLRMKWLWEARRSVGTLHFHWPQGYWRYNRDPRRLRGFLSWLTAGAFAARLTAAQLLGYRIVWTVHQVYPHEIVSPRLDRFGTRVLARSSDLLIAHDAGTAERVQRELGDHARKVQIVPHGSYMGVYERGRSRAQVRAELGISDDSFVFLCFGDLRAYKEVDLLLNAFRSAAIADSVLIVAGSVGSGSQAAAVQSAADADSRIRALLGSVDDDRVAELFDACDAAVLARGDGGTSGALILSLSMGVPVVAARTPAYAELTGDEEAGWLFEGGDADSLRSALERAARTSDDERLAKARAARGAAEGLRWPEIGARTAALIRGLDR